MTERVKHHIARRDQTMRRRKMKTVFIGAALILSIFAFEGLTFADLTGGVAPKEIDFGTVQVGYEVSQELIISNNYPSGPAGPPEVEVGFSLSGNGDVFLLPSETHIVMTNTSEKIVSITFVPKEIGERTATLQVTFSITYPLPSTLPQTPQTAQTLVLPPQDVLLTGIGQTAANHRPEITSISVEPQKLWPPDETARDVTISVNTSDPDGDDVQVEYTIADEYRENNVTSSRTLSAPGGRGRISLMAARDGSDEDGRVYTITVTAVDSKGAESDSREVQVIVPHDQGKNEEKKDK